MAFATVPLRIEALVALRQACLKHGLVKDGIEPLRLPACQHDGRLGAGLFAEGGQTDAYAGLGCEYMGNHRLALTLAEALTLAVR